MRWQRIHILFLLMTIGLLLVSSLRLTAQQVDVNGLRGEAKEAHEAGDAKRAYAMQLQVMRYADQLEKDDWDQFAAMAATAELPSIEAAIMKKRWLANPFHSQAGEIVRSLDDQSGLSGGHLRWLRMTEVVHPLILLTVMIVFTLLFWSALLAFVLLRKRWLIWVALIVFVCVLPAYISLADFYRLASVGEVALLQPKVNAYALPDDPAPLRQLDGSVVRLYPILQQRGDWLQIDVDAKKLWVRVADVIQIGTTERAIKKGELVLAPYST